MVDRVASNWSVSLGRWQNINVRLHILFPLFALGVAYLAERSPQISLPVAAIGLAILLGSVVLQELGRLIVVHRLGGRLDVILLAPTGGWATAQLPADPPAHLAMALLGPMVHLVLLVAAGCGLALAGEQHVLGLLNPFAPNLQLAGPQPLLSVQLVVWINWLLLLVNLLPVEPLSGAALLRGLLWPIVGRASVSVVTSRVALAGAILAAAMALLFQQTMLSDTMPAWLPLGLLAIVLAWEAGRNADRRQYDLGLTIDEFDSDDELWPLAEWLEEDREAVLVEHMQDKQQEVLDRKRRRQEASEDARVDAILAQLHRCTFDELSEADRTILKRASRRYRRRREFGHDA